MKIDVGTIIYIIDPEEKTVIPARINEQIVSRKIDGETITHKLQLPTGKNHVLETLSIKYFMSLEEVRAHLMDRAKSVIDKGIENAKSMAQDRFGTFEEKEDKDDSKIVMPPMKMPEENVKVTLPDGQVANVQVKIPKEYVDENSGY